jgi:hypothetical protein
MTNLIWFKRVSIQLTAVSLISVASNAWASKGEATDNNIKLIQIELNNLSFPKGDTIDRGLEGRPVALVIRKKIDPEATDTSVAPASERIAGILLETPVWATNGERSYKIKLDDGTVRTIEFANYQIIELWSAL